MFKAIARYVVTGWRSLVCAFRPARRQTSHRPHEVRLLVGSMVAVSAADGNLPDAEISLIQAVAYTVMEMDVGRHLILDAFYRFREVDFVAEIPHLVEAISPGVAELSLKCAVVVARADGELSDSEFLTIYRIAAALGVSRRRTSLCIEEGRALLESFRHQPARRAPSTNASRGD